MIQKKFVITTETELLQMVEHLKTDVDYLHAKTAFAQLFLSRFDSIETRTALSIFRQILPDVRLVGMSLYGDPFANQNKKKFMIFSFCFFTRSDVVIADYDDDLRSQEENIEACRQKLASVENKVAVLLFGTGLTVQASTFMDAVTEGFEDIPFFGAISNINAADITDAEPFAFGNALIKRGMVMAVFSGEDLHCYAESLFSWTPIGKEMSVTTGTPRTIGDTLITKIDGLPAAQIYKKYLNVEPNEQFISNICEFPLVVKRNGYLIPRVPCGCNARGELHVMGDVRNGETVRFTYGKTNEILKKTAEASERLADFAPEAIFLYMCANRVIFLKDRAIEERNYYFRLNSAVMYCHGFSELFRYHGQGGVFNSQLVTIGMREGGRLGEFANRDALKGISFSFPQKREEKEIPHIPESLQKTMDAAHPIFQEQLINPIPIAERLVTFLEATTTELNTANDDLKKLAAMANAANEAKSSFLSNMSHEIRTPINAVLGLDEMILRESTEENIKGYAQEIKSSGRTLLSLINDILDFSKIEAGKLEIIPVSYDMRTMLTDLVNMVEGRAKAKDLDFVVNLDPSLPHKLFGDETRVKQCILNVLTNAVKYTEKGSVVLDMGYEKQDDEHILLKVRIADTGIGIKQEDLKKLFSPFERIEESRNRSIEGTGLGLSIVKGLLAQMGTELGVQSEYGKGSEFSFSLRQQVLDWTGTGTREEARNFVLRQSSSYRESFQAPAARILIIDDTPMNLIVLQGLLKQTRIQIDTANSGMQALALARERSYHLIFSDHLMPLMDGIEFLHELRKDEASKNQQTTCIVLTANAISGAREQYLKEGFADYLSKPVDGRRVEQMLLRYLPSELIIREGEAGFIEQERKSDPSAPCCYAKFFAKIFNLDIEAGMKNCGGEDGFMDAVRNFYDVIPAKLTQIGRFAKAKDIRNYTIEVHSLKSCARLVGAKELSEQAAYLEQCGNEGNVAEIDAKTPALLSLCRSYRRSLWVMCQKDEAACDEKQSILPEELSEALKALKEVVTVCDFDSADSIISELDKYALPPSFCTTYTRIKEKLLAVDQQALLELL